VKKLLVLILAVFLLASCGGGGDGGTGPSNVFQGTFVHQRSTMTVEGATIVLTPPQMTGSIAFTADGRFTLTLGGQNISTDTYTGNCTVAGSEVTLSYDDGSVEVWTLSPDRNTLTGTFYEEGLAVSSVFQRS
jgi:hypothetical protein